MCKYFKTVFYFTEKNGEGIKNLDISEEIKNTFNLNKAIEI